MVATQRLDKVKAVLLGGEERHESSMTAIAACEGRDAERQVNLIFHDAVHPLVDPRIIGDVVRALAHYKAVDVVLPATDTIVQADHLTNTIQAIPDRSMLRCGQTPQGFEYGTIRDAYARAMKKPSARGG